MLRVLIALVLCVWAPAVVRAAEEGDLVTTFLPWTYGKGAAGLLPPEQWAEKYPECGGDRQSPIRLSAQSTTQCTSMSDASTWYFVSGGCTLGNAKAVSRASNWGEVAFEGCKPQLKAKNKTYNLLQVHFHSSAEHVVSGYDYAAEAHFVHVNENDPNDLIVVGIFLELRAEVIFQDNVILEPMLQVLSTVNEGARFELDSNAAYDVYSMLPSDPTVLMYPGSLTTPPCAEIVTWVLYEKPVGMSERQLQLYRKGEASVTFPVANNSGNNNRPVQPLNGRKVERCTLG